MPYTVTSQHGGIKRREFDVYLRLLNSRGIDWTNTSRVSEAGLPDRWLHVWSDRKEAESFRDTLRKETRNKNWVVRELPATAHESQGPLAPVWILSRRNSVGGDFSLHPHSRTLVQRRFPNANMVHGITIDSSKLYDVEQQHAPIWDHIAQVLTGLTQMELEQIGGYQILDLAAEQIVFDGTSHVPA